MKSLSRSALPPLDSRSRVPLALAAALVAALVFQVVAIDDLVLPEAGPIAGRALASDGAPDVPSPTGAGTIVARSIFSPGAGPVVAGAAPTDPLAGTTIAGSMRIGRALFAVVRGPGATTRYVRPGGRIGGWQLRAITPTDALLRRGNERLTVPFGGSAGTAATASVAEGSQ